MGKPALIIFLGKGGTGKSTLAAAAAVHLAGSGIGTDLVSLDPAHNLGDIFGTRRARFRPCPGLTVREVDPAAWTRRYLRDVRDEARRQFRYWSALGTGFDGMVGMLREAPGVEEYALLKALAAAVRERRADRILVLDTPPTALALRILTLPAVVAGWTRRLAGLRGRILRERLVLDRLAGGESVPVAGYAEAEDPVSQRLASLNGEYADLESFLASRECLLYVIVNPDRLSRREGGRICARLAASGMVPAGIIGNRWTDDAAPPAGEGLPAAVPLHRVPVVAIPDGAGPGVFPLEFITERCADHV